MAWSIIRKATEEEITQLAEIEKRIAARYDVTDGAVGWDNSYFRSGYASYDAYWQKCAKTQAAYRRAVRKLLGNNAEGIAYGYVGYHVS